MLLFFYDNKTVKLYNELFAINKLDISMVKLIYKKGSISFNISTLDFFFASLKSSG